MKEESIDVILTKLVGAVTEYCRHLQPADGVAIENYIKRIKDREQAAYRSGLDRALECLPEDVEPSDPLHHNQPFKEEPEYEGPDEDGYAQYSMPPKSTQILKNYNDGYNAAIAEARAGIEGEREL